MGKYKIRALGFCSEVAAEPCHGSQTGNMCVPLRATIAVVASYTLPPTPTRPPRSPPRLSLTAPIHLPPLESSVTHLIYILSSSRNLLQNVFPCRVDLSVHGVGDAQQSSLLNEPRISSS